MSQIEVKNVSKAFGDVKALNNVSLTLEEGKIYGLLGRNGAGKSTLLGCITNMIFPDSGEIILDREPIRENDRALGKVYMMSEKNYYPKELRVRDVFRWTNEFYGHFDMECANRLCEEFQLDTKKKVSKLSTGYNSIYKVITALSLDLPFIFFDEPVLGLDAHHRDLFYRLLLENYAENPKTIVISTHLIEEVAGLVENIIMMGRGSIIADGSCSELLDEAYVATGPADAVDRLCVGKNIIGHESLGGLKSVYVKGIRPAETVPEIEITKPDLQKLFIQMTR